MFESIQISDLDHRQCKLLRRSSNTRPTLWIIERNGVRAVVKDYSSNRLLYRNTVGRFLVWRESKAYRRLRGLRGIPTYYRSVGGVALVMEEISGRSIEGLENEKRLPREFFEALRRLVESVHKRGLAHCDLKRAPNILLGHDGHPYIVDWSASISERGFRFFPFNLIYKKFLLDDLNAITKLQLRHSPDSVTPEEKMRYYHRSKAEEIIRFARDRLRELLQKIA